MTLLHVVITDLAASSSMNLLTVDRDDYGYDQGVAAGCHAFYLPLR